MKRELRNHQKEMVKFMQNTPRAFAIACCGAGKTLAAIRAFPHNVLIVAPLRVARISWKEECEVEGVKYNFISGKQFTFIPDGVNVTNFENVHNIVGKVPKYITTLVIDESSKLKNFQMRGGTKRSKLLYTIAQGMQHVTLMTGTPASESIGDIYSQVTFLDGGRTFGSSKFNFMLAHCVNVSRDPKYHIWKENDGSREKVLRMCKQFTQTFTPDMKLIPSVDISVKYHSQSKKTLGTFVSKHILRTDTADVYGCNAAVVASKALHIVSGFSYTTDKGVIWHDKERLYALQDVLEEVGDERCVIVAYWRASMELIINSVPNVTCDISAWKEGHIKHLLINPASAGHGLSLQHQSRRMVLYEPFFSGEQYEQVLERLSPIRQAQSGYERTVYYHYIESDLGIDNEVWKALRQKKAIEQTIIDYFKK